MAAMQSFIFGAGTGETPESLARKREVADALASQIGAPRNMGEGLSAVGKAIASVIMQRRADAAEQEGRSSAGSSFSQLFAPSADAGMAADPAAGMTSAAPVAQDATAMTAGAPKPELAQLYEAADSQIGIPGFSQRVAQIESSQNPNAKNPKSSAGGLYQFIDGTAAQYGLRNKFDPVEATSAFTKLALDNKATLTRGLGREPTAGELYLAHQQGAGGALKLLRNGDAPASALVGGAAAGLNGGGGATGAQLANRWTSKFSDLGGGGQMTPAVYRPDQQAAMQAQPSDAMTYAQPNRPSLLSGVDPNAMLSPAAQPAEPPQQQAMASAQPAMGVAAPAGAPIQQVQASPVQRVAQAMPSGQQGPTTQQLVQAAQNPWLSRSQQGVVQALLAQRLKAEDPMSKLELQKTQLEIENLRRGKAPEGFTLGEGQARYGADGQLIAQGAPKRDDPPNDVRKYQFYVEQETAAGRQPLSFNNWDLQQRRAGASSVNVETGGTGELRKKLDGKQGESWSTILDAGTASAGTVNDIEILGELSKQAPTGPITGRLAQAFPGVNSAADAFQSVISRVAPTLRAPGSGATSDIEYEGMVKSLPSLRNKPEANAAIIGMMRAKADINIKRAEVITRYQNGEISDADARRELGSMNRVSIMTPQLQGLLQATGEQKAPAPAPSSGPQPGMIEGGYRFKGGDPSKPESWEPVT